MQQLSCHLLNTFWHAYIFADGDGLSSTTTDGTVTGLSTAATMWESSSLQASSNTLTEP